MKSKLRMTLMLCALVAGLSVSASAQATYRTRDGRTVTVYPQGRRTYGRTIYQRDNAGVVIRRPNGRTIIRRPDRTVVVLPNGRRVIRSSRSRQSYPQWSGARTYRTRDGRIVTVLPNGRRIVRN